MKKSHTLSTPNTQMPFLLYSHEDTTVRIKVLMHEETIWLPQRLMAELFDTTTDNISLHLRNIYSEGELFEPSTSEDFSVVQTEGERTVRRTVRHYNLDTIIAVGYRVNSKRATQFRIWATQILKEYIKKGFALDDERLKQGERVFGQNYFQELLERIRSIRASERRIYQQITDIFAECSVDYNPQAQTTREFYAMVQNKFHYAITGSTAAEIIYNHADHAQQNMGLQTWKHAPKGRVLSSDVTIAKNYLSEKEISVPSLVFSTISKTLSRIVRS